MSLARIGPIAIQAHGDPSFSWTGADGSRGCSISGRADWPQAQQLVELVENRHRRPDGGVLEYVHFDDGLLAPNNGWYLLRSAQVHPAQEDSLGGAMVPVQVDGAFLGPRQAVVARSARTKANLLGLTGMALVANPFFDDDVDGGPFVVAPGPRFRREYDAAPYSIEGDGEARAMTIYAVNAAAAPVMVPAHDASSGTPRWVAERGGDVRGWDRRLEREVYGPGHPFALASDLVVTNGLVRLWCGNNGLPPYLSLSVYRDGAWRSAGCLVLDVEGSQSRLVDAHLVRLTPDVATLRLVATGLGDILVTLRRGERMVRVVSGSSVVPLGVGTRAVRWLGLPPAYTLDGAVGGTGRYGSGLSLAEGVVTVLWPRCQPKSSWAFAANWLPPDASGDQGDHTLWQLRDDDGAAAVTLDYVASTRAYRVTIGAEALSSAPLTFAAGAALFAAVRHSSTDGTTLTVSVAGGAAAHARSAAMTASGTAGRYHRVALGAGAVGTTVWGDGAWGDGVWGGEAATGEGVLDNPMIFEDPLTDAEAEALATSATALGGIPSPEGRLVWHAPLDVAPMPAAAAPANGRRQASTAVDGLTWVLAGLSPLGAQPDGLALSGPAPFTAGAFLASGDPYDTAADLHNQFASECEQAVMVR